MPTRRSTRKQRGGFLDWLFGSSNTATNTEKKNETVMEAAPAMYSNAAPVMGGRRRKSRKGRKAAKRTRRNRRR